MIAMVLVACALWTIAIASSHSAAAAPNAHTEQTSGPSSFMCALIFVLCLVGIILKHRRDAANDEYG